MGKIKLARPGGNRERTTIPKNKDAACACDMKRGGKETEKAKEKSEEKRREGRGAAAPLKPQSNDRSLAPRLTRDNAAIAIFSNCL